MRVTVRINVNGKDKEYYFPNATDACYFEPCQSFRVAKEKTSVYFPVKNVYEFIIYREEEEGEE